MGNSMEFISNHPVLSVALFIFIYLIISYEVKNFTKKYKSINCNDLVQKINEESIIILDTRERADFKKGHISHATNYEISQNKKLEYTEVVVYDKDEMASANSAEKISKNNNTKVIYLEGGIQSWIENNLPLVEKA
jgi:rhodanese-related sulfurtransferase|uniref:Predicted secreted protein STY4092 n=1 Tax=uncultured bacterium BAC13K9BAC TaxID=332979 RepID=Q4JMY0_9BACT|nr:predicted secreted protein STY4092 [uncultured bacterium BAC13K9BAC]